MEVFFGLLKKEFWHSRDWSGWTPARFIEELGGWIGRRCEGFKGCVTTVNSSTAINRPHV